jgi:hypothetical protein
MSALLANPTVTPAASRQGSPFGMVARVALAVLLLVGSGCLRSWQARRVDAAMNAGRESPFPLSTISTTLGDWIGTPTELDARIVEGTGSTDHITRRYVDRRTGVAIDAIILYGPTSDIFIHAPELCYPKAGFSQMGDAPIREIAFPGGKAPFRSLEYTRGDAGQAEYQEVYYSWRYNGRWSTSVSSPKESERIPGMYKVQLARRISRDESRNFDNPCEAFLELLIPDLEARITGAAPKPGD